MWGQLDINNFLFLLSEDGAVMKIVLYVHAFYLLMATVYVDLLE